MKKNEEDKYRVELKYSLLDSAAWTALSYEAQWLYIELRKQWNDDRFVLPYSEVSWRMSKNTYWKKIKELIAYGFIKRVVPGGLMNNPTVYALSEGWKRKSREIMKTEGREAIQSGLVKKRSHRAIDNLPKPERKKSRKRMNKSQRYVS